MRKITNFIINGFMISASSMLLSIVDSAFTVYLSGRIGADGIGLFGLVNSVYRFGVTLSLAGLGLAATKTVSEKLAKEDLVGAKKSGNSACLLGLLFGLFSGALLYLLSPAISLHLLSNEDTVLPLRILSMSLPFISMSGALGGIFIAYRRSYLNVLSGIICFIVKIAVSVLFLYILPFSLENSCIAVSLGLTLSEALSFILSLVFFVSLSRKIKQKNRSPLPIKNTLSISLPVALSSYVRSALSTAEQLLIPKGLVRYGKTQSEALGEYGLIKGMVLPVVLMPSTVLYSFSGLLVPELSASQATKNKKSTNRILSSVFSLTLIYSVAVCGILMFFAEDISLLLYKSTVPAVYIRIIAPLCVVMYLDGAVDNVLKGLGEQVYCMKINIIDAFLSLVSVFVLVPIMGINGYVVTILVSEIFNTVFSVLKLIKITEFKFPLCRFILLTALLIISSVSIVSLCAPLFLKNSFIPSAILSLVIYFILCYFFSLFPKKT